MFFPVLAARMFLYCWNQTIIIVSVSEFLSCNWICFLVRNQKKLIKIRLFFFHLGTQGGKIYWFFLSLFFLFHTRRKTSLNFSFHSFHTWENQENKHSDWFFFSISETNKCLFLFFRKKYLEQINTRHFFHTWKWI